MPIHLKLEISDVMINVFKLPKHLIEGAIVTQSDVLEELDVQKDGKLVQLFDQDLHLVIHGLR